MSDPGGCKLMNCTDLKDGKCHYPGDTCKYREDEDLERKLAAAEARIKELEGELEHLATSLLKASKCFEDKRHKTERLEDENKRLRQERDAMRRKAYRFCDAIQRNIGSWSSAIDSAKWEKSGDHDKMLDEVLDTYDALRRTLLEEGDDE